MARVVKWSSDQLSQLSGATIMFQLGIEIRPRHTKERKQAEEANHLLTGWKMLTKSEELADRLANRLASIS